MRFIAAVGRGAVVMIVMLALIPAIVPACFAMFGGDDRLLLWIGGCLNKFGVNP